MCGQYAGEAGTGMNAYWLDYTSCLVKFTPDTHTFSVFEEECAFVLVALSALIFSKLPSHISGKALLGVFTLSPSWECL